MEMDHNEMMDWNGSVIAPCFPRAPWCVFSSSFLALLLSGSIT